MPLSLSTEDGRIIVVPDEERQPCEVWTRVMGYYRPVAFFNKGKKGEYRERVNFLEAKAMAAIARLDS